MRLLQKNQDSRFAIKGKTESACLSISGDKILIMSDLELVCMDTETGERLWVKSLPKENSAYLSHIVRNNAKDEFLVYYGFQIPYIEIFDAEGNLIVQQAANIRYCYASFALTNEHIFIADDFKWQVIERKTASILYEKQFEIPPNDKQYDEYTQPYFAGTGESLIFVKRKKVLCYEPLTGKLRKEIKGTFDGHNGIYAYVSQDGKYFLHFDKQEQKLNIYCLPDFKIIKTCIPYAYYASALSFDFDGERLLFHFTSPMICYFDIAKATEKEVHYEWRFSAASLVEKYMLHPTKPIFYELGRGRVIRRNLLNHSKLDNITTPDKPIHELIYDEKSKSLLGIEQYDYEGLPIYFDENLQANSFGKIEVKGYDRKKRILYGMNNYYDFQTEQFYAFQYEEKRYGEAIAPYKKGFITVNKKGNNLILMDKNGIQTHDLKISAKNIPGSKLTVIPSLNEYWGVKNGKKIITYSFDNQTFKEIKSKLVYPVLELLSPNEKYFLLLVQNPEGKIEVFDTQTKKALFLKNIPHINYAGFTPNNSILVAVNSQLIEYQAKTGEEIARFEVEMEVAAFTFGNKKLFIIDELRNVYEFETPWEYTDVAEEIQEWTLPPHYKDWEDDELTEFVQNLDAEDFPLHKIPDLRDLLLELEARNGITGDHFRITAELCQNEFKLMHFYAIRNEITNSALSPDQKYAAFGSWVGDDYDEGGEFMLLETATGKCVNAVQRFNGGFGWPDYYNGFQFSPDGKWLAFTHNTNSVGIAKVFNSDFRKVDFDFNVTDGWSRPPQFRWKADSKSVCIKMADGYYVCPLGKSDTSYSGNLEFVKTHDLDNNNYPINPNEFAKEFENLPCPPDFLEDEKYIYKQLPENEKVATLSPTKRKDATFPELLVEPEFPVYAGGKWQWIAAQNNGWIVCPPALQPDLDNYLHLTFGNRYAWFFRWVPANLLEIYDNWNSAILSEKCLLDAKNKAKMATNLAPDRKNFFKLHKRSDKKSIYAKFSAQDLKNYPPEMEIPLKNSDSYEPDIWFDANDILSGKANHLIGKVVFAVSDYGTESFGTLISIEANRNFCSIFRMYGSSGSYGTSGSSQIKIAEAKMGDIEI